MKAVVTGGAGFIGSHVAEALLPDHDVHVVDDLGLGRAENVPRGARLHRGSVLDRDLLARVFQGATHVYHHAALPSVAASMKDPLATHEANATGTLNVLLAARDAGVEKVVLASTSAVYGDATPLPAREDAPSDPRSPYAVSKLAAEDYCRVFHRAYGLRATALRYFNVYGPRQDPGGAYPAVIARFARQAALGEPITILGDGTQTRDFVHVRDVARANLLASASTRADGHVVNVGSGRRTSLLDLADLLRKLSPAPLSVQHGPARAGDVAHSVADVSKAHDLLGFRASIALERGVEEVLADQRGRAAEGATR